MNNAQWTVIIISGVIALILLGSYGGKSSAIGQLTLLLQNIFSGPSGPKAKTTTTPVIGGGNGGTGVGVGIPQVTVTP